MNDEEFHGDINYGNRFPEDWYWHDEKESLTNYYILDNDYED